MAKITIGNSNTGEDTAEITLSNTTKLAASLAIVAFILLVAAVIANFMNGVPKHLDTVLALSAGVFGIIGSMVGFAYSSDNP